MEGLPARVCWAWSPQNKDLADAVNGSGAGARRELVAGGGPLRAVVVADLHVYKLGGGQRTIDFGDQRVGHTGTARLHNGFERMRPCLEVSALASRQRWGHPSLYEP